MSAYPLNLLKPPVLLLFLRVFHLLLSPFRSLSCSCRSLVLLVLALVLSVSCHEQTTTRSLHLQFTSEIGNLHTVLALTPAVSIRPIQRLPPCGEGFSFSGETNNPNHFSTALELSIFNKYRTNDKQRRMTTLL